MVPEIITGRRSPRSSNSFFEREQRGLGVERVEDGFDHEHVAPPSIRPARRFA